MPQRPGRRSRWPVLLVIFAACLLPTYSYGVAAQSEASPQVQHQHHQQQQPVARSRQRRTMAVASANEFIAALVDDGVERIVLQKDVSIPERLWPQEVVVIARDVEITAVHSALQLHFNYARLCIRLEPNVILRFSRVVGAGLASVRSFDFIAPSPRGHLLMQDAVWKSYVCAPFYVVMEHMLANSSRPAEYPGTQKVQPLIRRWCHPGQRGQCAEGGYHLIDFATEAALMGVDPDLEPTPIFVAQNNTWACQHIVRQACLDVRPYDECRTELLAAVMSGKAMSYNMAFWAGLAATASVLFCAVAYWQLSGNSTGCSTSSLQQYPRNLMMSPAHSSQSSQRSGSQQPASTYNTLLPVLMSTDLSGPHNALDVVQLDRGVLLGQGSFGKVYRGLWQGKTVAVKVISHERQTTEKISHEAGVSMSVIHPNVVRTLHYFTRREAEMTSGSQTSGNAEPYETGVNASFGSSGHRRVDVAGNHLSGGNVLLSRSAVGGPSSFAGGGPSTNPSNQYSSNLNLSLGSSSAAGILVPEEGRSRSWLVQEYCDLGAMHKYMQAQAVAGINLLQAAHFALDIARGMAYLHELKICHGDLKAGNVLLCSDPASPARARAKVADFGMSRVMANDATHLSTQTLGTLTHMPPEMLIRGQLTQRADSYSYGILLWEMATGKSLWKGMNPAMVIHKVTYEQGRPIFPAHVPEPYVALAKACWCAEMAERPLFPEIVSRVEEMLKSWDQLCGQAAAVGPLLMFDSHLGAPASAPPNGAAQASVLQRVAKPEGFACHGSTTGGPHPLA